MRLNDKRTADLKKIGVDFYAISIRYFTITDNRKRHISDAKPEKSI